MLKYGYYNIYGITMKRLLCLAVSIYGSTGLVGCGLFTAPPQPTPKQVTFKVNQIVAGTPVNLIGLIPMDLPNPRQKVVTNNTVFRVTNDVVGSPDSVILIPQDSLLSGTYYNDGTKCYISWQALYSDYRAMELNQGYLGIDKRLANTSCNPQIGIQPGQNITVTFQ